MMRNGKILFSSLKGGVGKSSAASAVAAALASDGYKTVIADLDFRSRSLDLMLGVADRVLFTFDDYRPKPLPYVNATSLIFRVNLGGQSVMILGDASEHITPIACKMYGTYPPPGPAPISRIIPPLSAICFPIRKSLPRLRSNNGLRLSP